MQITITIDTNNLSSVDRDTLRALSGETTEKSASQPKAAKAAEPKAKAAKAAEEPETAAEETTEEDTDGATLDDAVAIATKLVSSGEAAKVKAALGELGAKRVSELSGDKVAKFVAALS